MKVCDIARSKPSQTEQVDAVKPSIDRAILELCYLLGLTDPKRSVGQRDLLRWSDS